VSSSRSLRVTYLLAGTELFGGVAVVLHQANLLHSRGHSVRVVSTGERPSWYRLDASFERVGELSPPALPPADVTVATYWTTLAPALAADRVGQVLHYCQGFEGAYTHNTAEHPRIFEAYAAPVPAMAVSPHLVELLRKRFGRPGKVVSPGLAPCWRPRRRFGLGRRPRILVVGPLENDWKGVPTALEAVRILRSEGRGLTLVRLSQWPLSEGELQFGRPEEYHQALPPSRVPSLVAACDLLLAPSWEQEGFGLPVLEAFASGVPVVASRVPSFNFFAAEAAELVPPRDPEALAAAAGRVLDDRRRWRSMRRAGLAVAGRFSERAMADALETALEWAASGAWRSEA